MSNQDPRAVAPGFLRRRSDPVDRPLHDDPDVKNFLTGYAADRRRLTELEAQLHEREKEIDRWGSRAQWLELELKRCQIQRDEYQAGYAELKSQLAMVASTAAANLKGTIDVIEVAVRNAHAKMERAGVASPPSTTAVPSTVADALEDGIRAIGEKFGANTRKEEPEVPAK